MSRLSIRAVLLTLLPGLTIVLVLLSALSVADLFQARQRYEATLAQTYRVQLAVREVRSAAAVELAVAGARRHVAATIRRAHGRFEEAVNAARRAVAGDAASEQLLARQVAGQRQARAAVRDLRGGEHRGALALSRAVRGAETAAAQMDRIQRTRQDAAAERVHRETREAVVRSGIAALLAMIGTLGLLGSLLRSLHRPLTDLVAASERLAANDLGVRLVPAGPAELRRLSEAYNAMAAALQARAAELGRALIDVEQASEAKSIFLSRMSHELRTPLNAILGFAQVLEMDDLTDAQREHIAYITQAGRHLLVLIEEVIDVARAQPGTARPSLESVDLSELIHDVVESSRQLARERGVTVEIELPDERPPRARADREWVSRILRHLVTNGIKYNSTGGQLKVATDESDEFVRLLVSDTGPGIPPDQLPKVFAPFERLGADNTGVDGVGLGLALSRQLAQEMNGTLDVTSEVGRGSVFTLTLRRADAGDDAVAAEAQSARSTGSPAARHA